jgi:tryptophan-rich sensory protein
MACFAIYLAYAWPRIRNRRTFTWLYLLQWLLNAGWNPVFFTLHQVLAGFVMITMLTLLVAYFFFAYFRELKTVSLLLLPYLLWMLIATSLNGFILLQN